jgi:hypothetical protein
MQFVHLLSTRYNEPGYRVQYRGPGECGNILLDSELSSPVQLLWSMGTETKHLRSLGFGYLGLFMAPREPA